MRKIPGTLYKLDVTKSREVNKLNLKILYRDQIVLENSGIIKNDLQPILQTFLEKEGLSIPKNRIDWFLQEVMNEIKPDQDISFIESTVSEMVEQIQHTPEDQIRKIILIGLSNAGKTCIYERIFEGKKPWELMHSTATKGIEYRQYDVGSISKPMIWDLGGQQQYFDEYHGNLRESIFRKASVLLYIVDVSDTDKYEAARSEFEWAVSQIIQFNPNAKLSIFLHKIDLIHDKDAVLQYLKKSFTQNINHEVKFHYTSIFDESLFNAWSEVISDISPKTTFINSILKQLKNQEGINNALLLEKSTGLACGSTLDESEEVVAIGMMSLLIITIDKIAKQMKLANFKEFRLRTTSDSILLTDVSKDLILVIILTEDELGAERIKQIEDLGQQVSQQIRMLWK